PGAHRPARTHHARGAPRRRDRGLSSPPVRPRRGGGAMPAPRPEQGSTAEASARPPATLGFEATLVAVLALIGVVALAVADEDSSAGTPWLIAAVVGGAVLL